MYKLVVYIPLEYKERVKEALFDAGAGKQGHYDQCSFEVVGQGQFRPLEGSEAFIGNLGELETVKEVRVEMLVLSDKIYQVVQALRDSHPYEEPAFDVIKLEVF